MSDPKRINLSVRLEKAVLVKVYLGRERRHEADPLAELTALAEAAGATVVGGMTQNLPHPTSGTFLGSGKVEELKEEVERRGANLVIFDNDLLPNQIRELEEQVNCKIVDRSELILDIFASRARTYESKLQVELAQLEYTTPRLRGMWTHLEKIAGAAGGTGVGAVGGIGTRGPGEKQIEIDRRIVRDRVSALKRELATINERKMRTVQSRRECFTVSLVGYTNSGKSTLLNRLTNAGQFVADMLFATLDTKTVRWAVDESTTVLLSDTVGFVRDLPHHLVASFRATLEEALHADLLLHVVDASNPYAVGQVSAVHQVLDELGCESIPTVAVLNKIDAVTDHVAEQILTTRLPNAIRISALTGEGINDLADAVRRAATASTVRVTLRVPAGDGRLAALIDREARVLERRYLADVVELDVRMERRHLDRLTGQHPELVVVAADDAAPAAS